MIYREIQPYGAQDGDIEALSLDNIILANKTNQ